MYTTDEEYADLRHGSDEEYADIGHRKPASVIASIRRSFVRLWQRETETTEQKADRIFAAALAQKHRMTERTER